jgi:precorrin-6B methylase 2
MRGSIAALVLMAGAGLMMNVPAPAQSAAEEMRAQPEVPFVPTPDDVVQKMLEMANVTNKDVVYDLGSGDGRIVIAAAKMGAARAVGVDIDPERIKESNENAKKAGVTNRVKFINNDLFKTDLSEATVVTLYLLPGVNNRLKPKLLRELRPGARVVSHSFDMDDWEPKQQENVDGRTVYHWVIPEREEALRMATAAEQALKGQR